MQSNGEGNVIQILLSKLLLILAALSALWAAFLFIIDLPAYHVSRVSPDVHFYGVAAVLLFGAAMLLRRFKPVP